MDRLEEFVTQRRVLAQRYNKKLADLPLQLPTPCPDSKSSWHLYVIKLQPERSRREVFDLLREADIGVNVHYIPVHLHPFYRRMGFKEGDFPAAESYYAHALTLPLYPGLTFDQQDYICHQLETILTGHPHA